MADNLSQAMVVLIAHNRVWNDNNLMENIMIIMEMN